MAIDVDSEETLTLQEAGRNFPGRGVVSVHTLHRWRMKGFKGVKLECIRVGQVWRTSVEAMKRFVNALNPVPVAKAETPAAQRRRTKSAMHALQTMGIGSGPKPD